MVLNILDVNQVHSAQSLLTLLWIYILHLVTFFDQIKYEIMF